MKASGIVWKEAGRPIIDDCEDNVDGAKCQVCTQIRDHGLRFGSWQGANFTNQNRVELYGPNWICAACVWAHSWTHPPDTPEPDGRGPCLRHFSHFWSESQGYSSHKRDARGELLLSIIKGVEEKERWFASIALSAQKHVLPYTDVNMPGQQIVNADNQKIMIADHEWFLAACRDVAYLFYDLQIAKKRINTGEYRSGEYAENLDVIEEFEARHGDKRGLSIWNLVMWFSCERITPYSDLEEYDEREDEKKKNKKSRTQVSLFGEK